MERKNGIELALEKFDNSPTKLAQAVGGSVMRQHVEHWIKAGRVPAERCPQIEQATDGLVRCEDLRPDVQWSVLRGTELATPQPVAQEV